jgi:hypothetical protein
VIIIHEANKRPRIDMLERHTIPIEETVVDDDAGSMLPRTATKSLEELTVSYTNPHWY